MVSDLFNSPRARFRWNQIIGTLWKLDDSFSLLLDDSVIFYKGTDFTITHFANSWPRLRTARIRYAKYSRKMVVLIIFLHQNCEIRIFTDQILGQVYFPLSSQLLYKHHILRFFFVSHWASNFFSIQLITILATKQ